MIKRFAKALAVSVRLAVVGFNKCYKGENENIASILGMVDPLTRIPNRLHFEQDRRKIDKDHSLCFIDINKFKIINDNKGHQAGDLVLKRLATILTEKVGKLGRVYRYAGDEFIMVLKTTDVYRVVEAINESLREEDVFTISTGVTKLREQITDDDLNQADMDMYRCKRENDRVAIDTPMPA